jgi:hypothetical protein
MTRYDFIDGERVRKARSVRTIHPVVASLATRLAAVPALRYVKIFPERLAASNMLSEDGKNNPIVTIGAEGLVGVELLIDLPNKIVQFHALTSARKGCGRQIVDAVVGAVPDDWFLPMLMDWSGGFWEQMAKEYPRLSIA